eukprot:Ihof_evm1s600 gene=Ihof_evmTU1s600
MRHPIDRILPPEHTRAVTIAALPTDKMAEEADEFFDLSLKKKKKKKALKLDGEDELESQEVIVEEPKPEVPAPEAAPAQDPASDLEDEDFAFSLKKKKKKKKDVKFDDDEGVTAVEAKPKAEFFDIDGDGEAPANEDDMGDLMLTKKKKKKKSALTFAEDEGEEEASGEGWLDSDRDYTYDELLDRVFETMRQKNPDMVAGERKRMCLRPPQVVRIGTRRTAFVNFTEICKMIHRQPEHLMSFALAELGTSGAVDGQNQLVIKGRFQPKQIENILRRYIREYVTCHTCRSPDTILTKENRLFFLQCE